MFLPVYNHVASKCLQKTSCGWWIRFMLACPLTFPVRFDQINLLQYVSRSSTPCLDLWGIFSGDFVPLFSMWVYFLPEFAGFPVAVATFQGGLVTAWLILSRGDGHGKRWGTVTENGKWKRREVAHRFVRLRRMFTIFVLNNRVLRSWDNTQSRLLIFTQPLLHHDYIFPNWSHERWREDLAHSQQTTTPFTSLGFRSHLHLHFILQKRLWACSVKTYKQVLTFEKLSFPDLSPCKNVNDINMEKYLRYCDA